MSHTDLDTDSNVVELAREAVIRRDVNTGFDCHNLSSEKTDKTNEKETRMIRNWNALVIAHAGRLMQVYAHSMTHEMWVQNIFDFSTKAAEAESDFRQLFGEQPN